MKNIVFAVDIDETLASAFIDGKILETYTQKTGKNINISEVTDYYFSTTPGLLSIYEQYLDEFHDKLPLFENAKNVLQNLKNRGVKLIIITSREKKYQDGTRKFISENFGENFFEKILFTSDYTEDNKATLVKAENCDIVIDDALHHIDRYVAETDLQILKFSASWNVKRYDSNRVFEVNNWLEVENFFAKIL